MCSLYFYVVFLFSCLFISITLIRRFSTPIVLRHYLTVTTIILFVFSLYYSKIYFHIKIRCASENFDFDFYSIFHFFKQHRYQHFYE